MHYRSFIYRAQSWDRARRVIGKIEWHLGELFPRINFVVTNLNWSAKRVVRFYNKRGTAEQWITEGKHAVNWTRLSCHDFVDNQVRLQLFVLGQNEDDPGGSERFSLESGRVLQDNDRLRNGKWEISRPNEF